MYNLPRLKNGGLAMQGRPAPPQLWRFVDQLPDRFGFSTLGWAQQPDVLRLFDVMVFIGQVAKGPLPSQVDPSLRVIAPLCAAALDEEVIHVVS